MRIRPFEYHAAESLQDALDMAAKWGLDARVLAGGTDLVVGMKHKTILPPHLISLHKIKALDFVQVEESSIRIGALCRHADLASHPELKQSIPVLCEAVNLIGSCRFETWPPSAATFAMVPPRLIPQPPYWPWMRGR